MTAISRAVIQLLGCVLILVVGTGLVNNVRPLIDAQIYRAAVEAFQAGEDPYDFRSIAAHSGISLYFVYPPHFLVVAAIFAPLLRNPYALGLLALGYVASVVAIPYWQSRWMLGAYRHAWPLLGAFLFLAWFGQNGLTIGPLGFGGVVAIFCGTITLPLYGAALTGLACFFQRQQWSVFYIAVWLAACIKPQFLLLLAFPILLVADQFLNIVGLIVGVAAVYISDMLFHPNLWDQFLFAIHQQTIANNDVGRGAFGLVSHLFVPNGGDMIPDAVIRLAGFIQAVWLGFVACVAWRLRHRIRALPGQQGPVIAWITLTILVANPRLAVYDLCLGSIPFIVLSIELCGCGRRIVAAFGALLIGDFAICGFHFEPNFPILAIAIAWAFGAMFLMKTTVRPRQSPEIHGPVAEKILNLKTSSTPRPDLQISKFGISRAIG